MTLASSFCGRFAVAVAMFGLACLSNSATRADSVIFVDQSAAGSNDGTTWADAYTDLQSALSTAVSGEEIWVANGTYTPTTGTDRNATFQLVTGVGVYGGFEGGDSVGFPGGETLRAQRNTDAESNNCVLSGDLLGNDNVPADFPNGGSFSDNSYHIVSGGGTDATAVLDGFRIEHGNATGPGGTATSRGAGMFNESGSPTVRNCVFVNNFSLSGGAGMSNGDTITPANPYVVDCKFVGNISTDDGAGMLSRGSSPEIVRCLFDQNVANTTDVNGGGGGAASHGGFPVFDRCTFTQNNTAAGTTAGGGLFTNGAVPTVLNCTFTGNTAFDGGGLATYDNAGTTLIHGCSIVGNQALRGSALRNLRSTVVLANCLVNGNVATNTGEAGTIDNSTEAGAPADLSVINCTIVGNNAPNFKPGGLYNATTSVVSIANSIIWGNTDNVNPNGSEAAQLLNYSTLTVDYSLVAGLTGGLGGIGNIDGDPQFEDADGADNVAGNIDDDFRLLPNSPARDAGDNAALPPDTADLNTNGNTVEYVPYDLDGHDRIANGAVDMGAFELFEDCNDNGVPDSSDIEGGTSFDCNNNDAPDECDISNGTSSDCNENTAPDECDITGGTSEDCNTNGRPDECDIVGSEEIHLSTAMALNNNAASDSGDDYLPEIFSDGAGQWLAVWPSADDLNGTIGTDNDILIARSSDNGNTWTDPVPLNNNAGSDVGSDFSVKLATDGEGNWVAIWSSTDSLNNTIGSDGDILVARSSDNGVTWTDPEPLNNDAATDDGNDNVPYLDTDRAGNWVAVWNTYSISGQAFGSDTDIVAAHSSDNGLTWSNAVPVNNDAAGDLNSDIVPSMTTDRAGHWMATWQSSDSLNGTIGGDYDVFVAYSGDNGATWNDKILVNNYAAIDAQHDGNPRVATDRAGTWLIIWTSRADPNGTLGTDSDLFVARSVDLGVTWSDAISLNSNANTDTGDDNWPQITSDHAGHWVATWYTNDDLGATIGNDLDNLFALSDDNGNSWTDPAPLNDYATSDTSLDNSASLATDDRGNWVAVWHSYYDLGGTVGTDLDVFTASFELPIGSKDLNSNGVPDECEDDCNLNGVPDDLDIAESVSEDCNFSGVPDECELNGNDCNANELPDDCDVDCNTNGVPDDCEIIADCNTNGVPDECEPDTDTDGFIDACDNCPLDANADQADFDADTEGDACDADIDGDGVPNSIDVCDYTPLGAIVEPDGGVLGDLDGDCDVDLVDFGIMQSRFTGPG